MSTTPFVGWRIKPEDREMLLAIFPPAYENFDGDHITYAHSEAAASTLVLPARGFVIGIADQGGVQALVVEVAGKAVAPDGRQLHVTWSLEPGRSGRDSNHAIACGWTRLDTPIPLDLTETIQLEATGLTPPADIPPES